MKESEILEQKIKKEENTLKVFALLNKKIRAERFEKFEEIWKTRLEAVTPVTKRNNGSYTFNSHLGIIDFYPKSNKLLIRKQNKWIKPGLNFIINNIIKTKNEKK